MADPQPIDSDPSPMRGDGGVRVGAPVELSIGGVSRPGAMAPATALDALRLSKDRTPALRGLYVHVPFCFHKCHYCDFYSFVDREDRQGPYVQRLLREADAVVERGLFTRPIETIFVGGGTPTFLEPRWLKELLAGLAARVPFAAAGAFEWTVEANPETVTEEVAATLVEAGVNRVSLGAQSFHPAHLKTLERWHDPASVERAVTRLRAAGIRRLNLDLIFGIPGSTLEEWTSDIERALALGPDHLSCYGLTYEPNTALTKRLELRQFEPCDEDLEAAMFDHTIERLAAAGFEQYEISNYAKPGEACRHNLLYWTNADWWSLGPSGSAHVQGVRWKNVPRLTTWLDSAGPDSPDASSPVVDVECVDEATRGGEVLMVGLRLNRGLPLATVEACCVGEHGGQRRAAIEEAVQSGFLERAEGMLRFTSAGRLLADGVLAKLL